MHERSASIPISVVIPAFNAETFLEETFATIARQSVRPAEIIVVDDDSSDGTAALAARLGARVLSSSRNRGPSAARNAGVRIATMPWIAFLDADDLWYDGKLAAQWEALERWPDAGFCFTDYDVAVPGAAIECAEGSGCAGYEQLPFSERFGAAACMHAGAAIPGLVRSMFVRQSSVVMNRARFLEAGGYNESMRLAEDYDLFLRLGASAPVIAIERSYVLYRRREASLSADPLAEVRSIDDLWGTVLAIGSGYTDATRDAVRSQRVPALHRGVVRALRLGRFTDATALACKARQLQMTPATLAWCGIAGLVDNAAGARIHRAVRSLWRARNMPAPSS